MPSFPRIVPRQVSVLLTTLQECKLRSIQHIEALYNERAHLFKETTQFLKDIGWLRERRGRLYTTTAATVVDFRHPQDQTLGRAITEAIAGSPTRHRTTLAQYLSRYTTSGTALVHQPSPDHRSNESQIRNFLMASGIVLYNPKDDTYHLTTDCAHLFLWAKNTTGPKSKAALAAIGNRRDEIGAAAEIAALSFERQRVGPNWARQVEHVSAKNPLACFDIRSVTLHDGQPSPRFIEVKAVRRDDMQFFWSASEIEAAQLLGANYFLYLLPARAGGRFDGSELAIIQNPYTNVYTNTAQWFRQEKVILCRLRPEAKIS
jgi:hypothetical protein